MTNEELKSIWAGQTKGASPPRITPEVIWRLSKESAQFERTIFWRDTREWIATVLVAGCFGWDGIRGEHIHWLPIAAAIVACFPMTYASRRRRQHPAPEAAGSLTDHLRESIASVQHQIGLLGSVLWWYLTPIAIAAMIVILDHVQSIRGPLDARDYLALTKTVVFGAAISFVVWKANKCAVRKRLEPRVRALRETLAELES